MIGKLRPGAAPVAVAADQKRVGQFAAAATELLPKLEVYADTIGAPGSVRVRGVVYGDLAGLLGQGDEVLVPAGWGPGWLTLPFTAAVPGGVPLTPTDPLFLGVHAGDAGLRVYEDANDGPGGKFGTDTYSDGASAAFGASTAVTSRVAVYAPTFPAWAAAPGTLEVVLARLPFEAAQRVFKLTGPTNAPVKAAQVAWHGTGLSPERGSFAVAKTNGIFDPFVGERLLVTYGTAPARSVAVYVNDLAAIDEDLSLSRRAFKALAPLGNDAITATVRVLS